MDDLTIIDKQIAGLLRDFPQQPAYDFSVPTHRCLAPSFNLKLIAACSEKAKNYIREGRVLQYGYFDNEKREYVIDNVALPCSWTNYLGVEDMAAFINHTAGGYLFYKTPEYHRISRFRGNGVPMDRPGFYVYIRDNEKKDYHSISWQPVAKDLSKAKYRCRHGLSYTVYESEYDGLASSQTMVIPRGENVLL